MLCNAPSYDLGPNSSDTLEYLAQLSSILFSFLTLNVPCGRAYHISRICTSNIMVEQKIRNRYVDLEKLQNKLQSLFSSYEIEASLTQIPLHNYGFT